MKKVKIVLAVFDAELKPFEIPAFRGAVVEKVGRENVLFHNHLDNKEYLYKYPLIQYKSIQGKPGVMCIDEGADEIHKFFQKKDWSVFIGEKKLDMPIYQLIINQAAVDVAEIKRKYSIKSWIALNQENYKGYLQKESMVERLEMLQKVLTANIISFAKGIGWDVDQQIKVDITTIHNSRPVNFKRQKVMAFDLDFTMNVALPDYVGLGKGVSLGFGTVKNKQ